MVYTIFSIFDILGDFLAIRFDFLYWNRNRVESSRFGSKIIGIESGFESISNVGTVGSGRFQKLESKPDPTISLIVKRYTLSRQQLEL